MKVILALCLTLLGGRVEGQEHRVPKSQVQFRTVNIYIDPQGQPLAAYQLEFSISSGAAKIVGIEGGAHPAFAGPPFYDPRALQQERIIMAAFTTASSIHLPAGKTRVATIHLQAEGGSSPKYAVKAVTAATVEGKRIKVLTTFENGKAK